MHFEIDFLESHDPASLIAELQRVATKLGKRRLTARDIDQHALLSSRTVMQRFGTLRKALEAAGLVASRYTKSTDAELLKVVMDVWTITRREKGRRPRASEVAKYGFPVSVRTIVGRFGSWKRAMAAAARAKEASDQAKASPDYVEPVEQVVVVKKRRSLADAKRFGIFKRDLYECSICHIRGGELEVDHIMPVSRGGPDTIDNLQTLCKLCNRSKSDQLM